MSTDLGHAAVREIRRFGLRTPLVVPSFSSRGFPHVGRLLDRLRTDLYGVCLVSAFDLASHRIAANLADLADLVLVDSGVYETDPATGSMDGFDAPPAREPAWCRNSYREFLRTLGAEANVMAVNFDTFGPIEQQVESAREDFACAPAAAADLLLKPSERCGMIEVDVAPARLQQALEFDVLGVTDEELGDTVLQRCATLARLRTQITACGAATPIHVFGCIAPASMLAYFLSGADVFDGLNWLRMVYGPDLRPLADLPFTDDSWNMSVRERTLRQFGDNLRYLQRFQVALSHLGDAGPLEAMDALCRHARGAIAVVRAAGVPLPAGRCGET